MLYELMFKYLLNIDRHSVSIISPGSLCRCTTFTTFMVKIHVFFLHPAWPSPGSFVLIPHILPSVTRCRDQHLPLFFPPWGVAKNHRVTSQPHLLQTRWVHGFYKDLCAGPNYYKVSSFQWTKLDPTLLAGSLKCHCWPACNCTFLGHL